MNNINFWQIIPLITSTTLTGLRWFNNDDEDDDNDNDEDEVIKKEEIKHFVPLCSTSTSSS